MSGKGATLSVVSHGQRRLVERLLDDLRRLRPPDVALIIITINAAEAWEVPPQVAGIPVRVLRNQRPLGFASNHNQAFESCSTPWFAVINPDIRLQDDPFPPLIRALETVERCALAVPWQVDGDGRVEDFRRRLPTPWSIVGRALARGERGAGRLTPSERADWLAGSFMLLSSDAFRAVGGFDGRFRLYCEDVDLCIRLKAAGWRFSVVEQIKVVHDARRSSGRKLRYLAWHLQSFVRLWLSRRFWLDWLRRQR